MYFIHGTACGGGESYYFLFFVDSYSMDDVLNIIEKFEFLISIPKINRFVDVFLSELISDFRTEDLESFRELDDQRHPWWLTDGT